MQITSWHWHFHAPASARNFVELDALATAIERTVARLQRSFEQQRRFTHDAAHELKTDLAIIKSSLQLLSLKRRTQDEYVHGLDAGLSDFTRLESTVGKMLALARLEQPAEAVVGTCRFDAVLREAANDCHALATLHSVTLSLGSLAAAIVPLDPQDARLLCHNLLVNALQHSAAGGAVDASMESTAHTLLFTVRDHGAGISSLEPNALFEPFFRGDPSRSRKSGGTGLGLSICKAICRHAGGHITLENHPGGGAIATVTLPRVT